jgi:hypothetical protein
VASLSFQVARAKIQVAGTKILFCEANSKKAKESFLPDL